MPQVNVSSRRPETDPDADQHQRQLQKPAPEESHGADVEAADVRVDGATNHKDRRQRRPADQSTLPGGEAVQGEDHTEQVRAAVGGVGHLRRPET